jgi:hypothetical protein
VSVQRQNPHNNNNNNNNYNNNNNNHDRHSGWRSYLYKERFLLLGW